MEERRIKLRRHIQAARAWLLQADKSLERENDVQGDLKLMLAKAELAQTRASHRSWIKKVIPPLTALMIAGAVVLSDRTADSNEVTSVPPIIQTVEQQSESEISLLDQTPTLQPDTLVEVPAPEPTIDQFEPTYEAIEYEPIEEPIDEPPYDPIEYSAAAYEPIEEPIEYESVSAPVYEPTYEEPTYEPTYEPMSAAVPNEDMQQLMLDAGQILRAK
ncbi:MAG: hypothetical protein IJ668_03865 [Selenomonadaceae bacterium]|nr:hypothetical protein [Selenomonadaceae bacterium]MBR1579614.1 hypothetical protein [Selenomonadaceae bacterium]